MNGVMPAKGFEDILFYVIRKGRACQSGHILRNKHFRANCFNGANKLGPHVAWVAPPSLLAGVAEWLARRATVKYSDISSIRAPVY
jgi:hypothetical protein